MLSSECPGWVCYLEKVLGEKFVKYASPIKTPQLVAASIIRQAFADSNNSKTQENMFVGLIAPCFDKKLEAARQESEKDKKIIDLVLGTNEIAEFLSSKIQDLRVYFQEKVMNSEHFVDFRDILQEGKTSGIFCGWKELANYKKKISDFEVHTSSKEWGSSNGYIDYILQNTEGIETVEYKTIKNQNFVEVKVIFEEKERPPMLMAYIYGFKNIQNLIRRIKVEF